MRELRSRVVRLERLLGPDPGQEAERAAAAAEARRRLEALAVQAEARLEVGAEPLLP